MRSTLTVCFVCTTTNGYPSRRSCLIKIITFHDDGFHIQTNQINSDWNCDQRWNIMHFIYFLFVIFVLYCIVSHCSVDFYSVHILSGFRCVPLYSGIILFCSVDKRDLCAILCTFTSRFVF